MHTVTYYCTKMDSEISKIMSTNLRTHTQKAYHGFLPEISVKLGHLVLVHLVELWVDLLFRVHDILPEQVLWDGLHIS